MLRVRYFILGFLLVGSFSTNLWGESTERAGSWKYLVKRTRTERDNLAKKDKERVFVDKAFVNFGVGPAYETGRIQTFGLEKFTMARKIPRGLASDIPGDVGSEPNLPLPVQLFGSAFNGFPLKPEEELERGLRWRSTLYAFYGVTPDFPFPVTIWHEVKGYEQKKSRRCAVIEYTIAGDLKTSDHPEWFTEEQRQKFREEYYLKGIGTAYFDPAEGIIVEKDQTISWTRFGEKLWRFEDGKVGWKPTADKKTTVTISVSLIPEEQPTSSLPEDTDLPVVAYVLILSAAGIVIAGLILLLKKKASSRGKSRAT